MQVSPIDLWLDDIRLPPANWAWVKNVEDAKFILLTGRVRNASLDHDLGACRECMNGRTIEEWLLESEYQSMPHCAHVGTGYELVCWMEETGNWPRNLPTVHSANPVGCDKMQAAIRRENERTKRWK